MPSIHDSPGDWWRWVLRGTLAAPASFLLGVLTNVALSPADAALGLTALALLLVGYPVTLVALYLDIADVQSTPSTWEPLRLWYVPLTVVLWPWVPAVYLYFRVTRFSA